jgi:hypothetical protein
MKNDGDSSRVAKKTQNVPYFDISSAKYEEKYNTDNPNDISGVIKMGDLKYYNYALEDDAINQLFRTGLKNVKLDVNKDAKYNSLNMLSSYELEKNQIKEL